MTTPAILADFAPLAAPLGTVAAAVLGFLFAGQTARLLHSAGIEMTASIVLGVVTMLILAAVLTMW